MAWLKDLWRATLAHWWALMSCAVSNIVGVYALALQKDNLWLIRSSFVLAGVFIIVAIALAWKEENKRLQAEIENNKADHKTQEDVVRDLRAHRDSLQSALDARGREMDHLITATQPEVLADYATNSSLMFTEQD